MSEIDDATVIANLRETVERLIRERDAARKACAAAEHETQIVLAKALGYGGTEPGQLPEWGDHIAVSLAEELVRKYAEARELCQRFRMCADIHEDLDGIRSLDGKGLRKVCRDYDASQQPQPPQTEWVPWTAETRPKDQLIWTRFGPDHYEQYMILGWDGRGAFDLDEHIDWETLFECRQWSRDGVTWNRCGTEVAK